MSQQITFKENLNDELLTRLQDIVSQHKRVAVTGAPTSGKTTLTNMLTGCSVVHADVVTKGHDWSLGSKVLCDFVNAMSADRIVIEGVQTPRSIRKGMKVDVLVVLPTPDDLEKRHVGMTKGIATVIQDCINQDILSADQVVFL